MLPIVANIVASDAKSDTKHNAKSGFLLTSMYGLGVASAYAMLGAIVALFGRELNIIGWMQQPAVLIGFAIFFVILALYMLDMIHIRLPHGISNALHKVSQKGQKNTGSLIGSLVAGFFSAIVVSPCVSAPLAGALLSVSTIGDPVLGAAALFMLGAGLSTPLVILGATESKFLPEAGEWLNWVKHGFALLLFGVAIMLLARISESSWLLLLWGAFALAMAYWFWQWVGKGKMLTRLLASICALWAILLIVGASMGNTNPAKPLQKQEILAKSTNTNNNINDSRINNASDTNINDNNVSEDKTEAIPKPKQKVTIYTVNELEQFIKTEPKLLVDVWASWCIECKRMEKELFVSPPEQMQNWQLVKLDITEVNENSKAVMEKLDIFGPPALAFYKEGKLIGVKSGMTKRDEFIEMLDALNQ